MTRFRPDNTSGYSSADLAELNLAWQSLGCHNLDAQEPAAASLMDHVAEQLLAEYDAGKRGCRLLAFYYRQG